MSPDSCSCFPSWDFITRNHLTMDATGKVLKMRLLETSSIVDCSRLEATFNLFGLIAVGKQYSLLNLLHGAEPRQANPLTSVTSGPQWQCWLHSMWSSTTTYCTCGTQAVRAKVCHWSASTLYRVFGDTWMMKLQSSQQSTDSVSPCLRPPEEGLPDGLL